MCPFVDLTYKYNLNMKNYIRTTNKDQWDQLKHSLDNMTRVDHEAGVITRTKVEDGVKYYHKNFMDSGQKRFASILRENAKKDRDSIKDSDEVKMRCILWQVPADILHFMRDVYGMDVWMGIEEEDMPVFKRLCRLLANEWYVDDDGEEKEKRIFIP